eukprot:CAMPEP_0119570744 /NCGR_PEP_ID=MMETSP1352-20130426/43764_1 /TAXON_ID=265584 /ORGANISM="Stauroneis constricta, Strain CCMP1120" /LENGTH=449 /DNA_ID=CAMNT_0007620417 /DNA_START=3452 /DNA_END=4801 /DNA_ORIENTATION=-
MAIASAMVRPPPPKRPPPPRGPPPSKSAQIKKIGFKAPPPGPPKRPPPPRPPHPSSAQSTNKRTNDSANNNNSSSKALPPVKKQRQTIGGKVSIRLPVVLRDVDVFEKKHQVGQGTYGSVFVAKDKKTSEIVALKRINTMQEENGFPITALREVKILKALDHPNIVTLKEIVTSKETAEKGALPKNVFMVFEYLEYDLTGVLETPEIRLNQDHIKSWSQQLLSGIHYMHINKVIHRDLKASNLLVNRKGELKIADWGLARSWTSDMKRLTNKVITLWYRPPELLLGMMDYTTKIDMWSVGCIIAEMFKRRGFLKGVNEATQLDLIFQTCGHPTQEEWPDIRKRCRLWKNFEPKVGEKRYPNRLSDALRQNLQHPKWMTDQAVHLIHKLMELNPDNRWSALEALDAEYFFENPIVKPAEKLSMKFAVTSVHEMECRRKYEQKMAAMRRNK